MNPPPLDFDDQAAIAFVIIGLMVTALFCWIFRQWERGEIERTFSKREAELRDQDAFIKTIGVGPRLVVTHRKNSGNHNGEKEGAVHK
jgi:hypothetical protein